MTSQYLDIMENAALYEEIDIEWKCKHPSIACDVLKQLPHVYADDEEDGGIPMCVKESIEWGLELATIAVYSNAKLSLEVPRGNRIFESLIEYMLNQSYSGLFFLYNNNEKEMISFVNQHKLQNKMHASLCGEVFEVLPRVRELVIHEQRRIQHCMKLKKNPLPQTYHGCFVQEMASISLHLMGIQYAAKALINCYNEMERVANQNYSLFTAMRILPFLYDYQRFTQMLKTNAREFETFGWTQTHRQQIHEITQTILDGTRIIKAACSNFVFFQQEIKNIHGYILLYFSLVREDETRVIISKLNDTVSQCDKMFDTITRMNIPEGKLVFREYYMFGLNAEDDIEWTERDEFFSDDEQNFNSIIYKAIERDSRYMKQNKA